MTLVEVGDGLSVNSDEGCLLEPDERLRDPQDILTICSSVVTISLQSSDGWRFPEQGMFNPHARFLILKS
jgi:hypothetical protein